jgi:hypothetical protein
MRNKRVTAALPGSSFLSVEKKDRGEKYGFWHRVPEGADSLRYIRTPLRDPGRARQLGGDGIRSVPFRRYDQGMTKAEAREM